MAIYGIQTFALWYGNVDEGKLYTCYDDDDDDGKWEVCL